MTGNLKHQLIFKDRIGIVFDIARLMTGQGLNIVNMEVEQRDGLAKISIEIEKYSYGIDKESLFALFSTLPGLENQSELFTLPHSWRGVRKHYRTAYQRDKPQGFNPFRMR
ncbi:MAG: hypothetical protein KJ630_23560 [Proteobacteria bacterium]|nr:hypothetical protein [Pseudomonadota bacterium]